MALVERSRVEQAQTAEDNRRLVNEVDALKARLSEAAGADAEMTMLRSERDQIRTRVSEMLEQLEALSL